MQKTVIPALCLALACSKSVGISISPTPATVAAHATQQFMATVTDADDKTVTWSVQESAGGTVDANGLYTAPTATGTYHVVVTSNADKSKSATATVTVTPALNTAPSALIVASIKKTTYDGTTDDLLTGGLGKSGLQTPSTAPTQSNPPTAAELRKLAIYNNYRALVDATPTGGYGVLYGPNIDTSGNDTLGAGMIAGDETLAYADDGTGTLNVTMMVQVPATFDQANPCIVSAASSGSRGVYGAIATAGEWGLKHKCAVAYTDKGTGNGYYSMQTDITDDINGVSGTGAALGKNAQFIPNLTAAEITAFNATTANRFAYKHAHSQKNPEKDWGKNTLDAIEFAFYVLNEKYGPVDTASGKHTVTIFPGSTIVIAASVSNGGGSSLAAAEQDTKGLISGVVAGEPQIQVTSAALSAVTIKRGANAVAAFGKPLYDYFTIAALYQPCAAQSNSANAISTVNGGFANARCNSLKAAGLLTSSGIANLADEALGKLHAAGWEADSDQFHSSHFTTGSATSAVTVTYANAYGRFSVKDKVCNYTFGATNASFQPIAASAAGVNGLFGSGNGVPPSGGLVNLINEISVGGPLREDQSTSPTSTNQDYNSDGVICLRNLFTGTDANATKVKAGIAEVQHSGNLHGKPAILVQGRSDTLVPINHASRAYYAANQQAEGAASKVRFYEVTNAQHFDAFIPAFGGYQTRLIPLHRYVINSLDLMYAYLKNGTALPASQVVRTTPRTTAGSQIAPSAVPAIAAPLPADTITFSSGTLTVPD